MKSMKQEEFLKKVGIYVRYLNQFLGEGDVPNILRSRQGFGGNP